MQRRTRPRCIGVLALQGGFSEHLQLFRRAFDLIKAHSSEDQAGWDCREVRTTEDLRVCDALVIPGGESTTIALVAARTDLLEALRHFVKVRRKPTWGTCAGLVLLAEAANRTKQAGQELIGGLGVRVNRNHFGRQMESFHISLQLPFLDTIDESGLKKISQPFEAFFIRAPVVEKLLPLRSRSHAEEHDTDDTVVAPARDPMPADHVADTREVHVLATLTKPLGLERNEYDTSAGAATSDIVAVSQDNVLGTSFHPELTNDTRLHVWWLEKIRADIDRSKSIDDE